MDTLTHRLSRSQFDAFCAGAVSPEVMAAIKDGQYSRRRLLLVALVDASAGKPHASGPLENVEQAWQILMTADERHPDVVQDVVMSPSVGVWLVRTVQRLHGADLDSPPLWLELGFLHLLAAAVAVRVRQPCILGVPVVHGVVTLPTVGQIRFIDDDRTGFASLSVSATDVTLRPLPDGGEFELPSVLDKPEFVPVHRHEVVRQGVRLDVEVDDVTPYRLYSTPVPPRPLSRVELTRWCTDLDRAWDILTRWHPRFANELSAGLATVTPISPPTRVIGASASAAFGAVAASQAESPVSLAATLVHELQHSKLNAALDLVVLHTRDPAELGYAPWRDDPRPLTGLLHGIYAFTSTVEFWHVQRRCLPEPAGRQATFAFVHRHMQVQAVVENVGSAPDLTESGAQLVESAARRLARCPLDGVPRQMIDTIETSIVDHRARWRLRHVRPDAAYLREALVSWQAGTTIPPVRIRPPVIEPYLRELPSAKRGPLLRMKTVEPDRFTELDDELDDMAFVSGHFDAALAAYAHRLLIMPTDGDAWVGLGPMPLSVS